MSDKNLDLERFYISTKQIEYMILTDGEIKESLKRNEIEIEPFSEQCLNPASYDMRVGDRAVITKTKSFENIKKEFKQEEVTEINVKEKRSIIIPPGAFALLVTMEKIKLPKDYVGNIGMRSYYTRKGLILLSGIQIDPGFEGYLVLGACNLSPRSLEICYGDPICTIELHKLSREAMIAYSSEAMEQQKEGKIPRIDKDYLRTIETMSISDLTTALVTLSQNVDNLGKNIRNFWIPLILAIVIPIILKFLV